MARQGPKSPDKMATGGQSPNSTVTQKPKWGALLTIIGGLLILTYAIIGAASIKYNASIAANVINTTALSNKGLGPSSISGLINSTLIASALIGIIAGIIITISGYMMYSMYLTDRNKLRTLAIVALIFSIISIFGGGGWVIGLLLGIGGSVLVLIHKEE